MYGYLLYSGNGLFEIFLARKIQIILDFRDREIGTLLRWINPTMNYEATYFEWSDEFRAKRETSRVTSI